MTYLDSLLSAHWSLSFLFCKMELDEASEVSSSSKLTGLHKVYEFSKSCSLISQGLIGGMDRAEQSMNLAMCWVSPRPGNNVPSSCLAGHI